MQRILIVFCKTFVNIIIIMHRRGVMDLDDNVTAEGGALTIRKTLSKTLGFISFVYKTSSSTPFRISFTGGNLDVAASKTLKATGGAVTISSGGSETMVAGAGGTIWSTDSNVSIHLPKCMEMVLVLQNNDGLKLDLQ